VKKTPQILALHLKRFKYMESVRRLKKLSHRVVFPAELRLNRSRSIPCFREGCREGRRCSRDTYPESYITKYTSIRKLGFRVSGFGFRRQHPTHRVKGVEVLPPLSIHRCPFRPDFRGIFADLQGYLAQKKPLPPRTLQ